MDQKCVPDSSESPGVNNGSPLPTFRLVCVSLPFCERVVNVLRSHYLPLRNRGIPVPRKPQTIGEHLRRRRLELGLLQAQSARRLGVSTVTLSLWEWDKVYPTWPQQPKIIAYLGYDPFTSPALGKGKSNETRFVAFLVPDQSLSFGQQITRRRLALKKTRKECARELGVSVKTLWGWESDQHQPMKRLRKRIETLLGF